MPDWDSWDIAGYGTDSWWTDVENGDREPLSDWSDVGSYLEGADQVVVSFLDSDGETHYYTIDEYFIDYEAMADALDDAEDKYGLAG